MLKDKRRENNRRIGAEYEQKAVYYLEQKGYQIITCNYRCRSGEVDIIAKQNEYLVFLEVKYRKNAKKGTAAQAVTAAKMRKIKQVARYYLMQHFMDEDTAIRFDVVAIDGENMVLYQNAFPFFS